MYLCNFFRKMAYAVISFIEDGAISEIPTNWLQKDDDNEFLCWWPPANTKNFTSLFIKRTEPDVTTWSLLSVKVEKYCSKNLF